VKNINLLDRSNINISISFEHTYDIKKIKNYRRLYKKYLFIF
jgi:hypothetical protein